MKDLLINSIIWSIILNISVSYLATRIATPEEIKPSNGADNLSFKSQIIHMFVHHNQVIISSSIIIGLVVGLSIYLSENNSLVN